MKDRIYIKDNVDGGQHCLSGDDSFYLIDVTSQYEPIHHSGDIRDVVSRLRDIRGYLVHILDVAYSEEIINQKERDVFYRRHIDWNSLEKVGKEFGVTRERIRQIEAKVFEKLRLTPTPITNGKQRAMKVAKK